MPLPLYRPLEWLPKVNNGGGSLRLGAVQAVGEDTCWSGMQGNSLKKIAVDCLFLCLWMAFAFIKGGYSRERQPVGGRRDEHGAARTCDASTSALTVRERWQ